ncbi:MAG TPA: FAD-binding protein [Xanthobacteraceae bacterium]|nr:FAD-binding protein [Xanthobacteraceae bacterium]
MAARIRGDVMAPDHADYDAARRIWNNRFDRRPAVVVRVADAEDVAAALDHAARNDLAVAVRSGGHSMAGWSSCDGGLVIDLRRLNAIEIYSDGVVSVGAGVTSGALAAALDAHDMALPLGTCADVGVAGLALGGGLGFLNGAAGLTCDSLIRAELVLADGRRTVASLDGEPDLFWALRGAGANFGVVTRLTFLTRMPAQGYGGAVVLHGQHEPALRLFRDCCNEAPDALGLEAWLLNTPSGPLSIVSGFWSGDADEGRALLAPLGRFAEPATNTLAPARYAQAFMAGGAWPADRSYYQRSTQFRDLDDRTIAIMSAPPAPSSGTFLTLLHRRHGAAARIPATATAFPHRSSAYETTFVADWGSPAEAAAARAWVDSTFAHFAEAGRPVYASMLDAEETSRIPDAFGPNYERIGRLKARYDPHNRFRLNANVVPIAD